MCENEKPCGRLPFSLLEVVDVVYKKSTDRSQPISNSDLGSNVPTLVLRLQPCASGYIKSPKNTLGKA